MKRHTRLLKALLVVSSVGFWSSALAQVTTNDFAQAVEEKRLELRQTGEIVIGAQTIYGHRFVDGLYTQTGYRPLWDENSQESFLSAISTLASDGLNPNEYVFPEVEEYLLLNAQRPLDAIERLDLDILLSEGLIRALYNLAFGKVDPAALDPNFNFSRPLSKTDLTSLLIEHVGNAEVDSLLELARPDHGWYVELKKGFQKYRDIEANGGWPTIPDGPSLKPGDKDDRVSILEERLAATGDLSAARSSSGAVFYDDLVDALKRFQQRHHLAADGILGPATTAALNVSVSDRISQIRLNLERLRWYLHELEGDFIIVDIAGFSVYWVEDSEIVWRQIAQVGKEFTKTPVFADEIEYLDFNPTWTIPPGIIKRSVIPGVKRDTDYFEKKGFDLLDLDGAPVDPKSVDWVNLTGFPYLVRQPPGPSNVLGQVKFMFPNPHFVFLHDTNRRDLFDRSRRTFSSGCIRVNKPFDLAERLLRHEEGWEMNDIDRVVQSGDTTRVRLSKPMRIVIGYTTATARDGAVLFREDIYQRDPDVLSALDKEFRLRKQDI